MFALGANDKEIARCLDKTKQRLILAGAKLSKVPGQHADLVRFMSRLRGKQRDIACSWFRENCDFSDLPEVVDVIGQWHSIDDVSLLSLDQARQFWRAILKGYVEPKPIALLDEFLAGSVLPDSKLAEDEDSDEVLCVGRQELEAAMRAANGEANDALSGSFPAFVLAVAGVVRTDAGLVDKGRKLLSQQGGAATGALLPLLDVLSASQSPAGSQRDGSEVRTAIKLSSITVDDPADYSVLGQRSNVTPAGLSFVKIGALLHRGTLVDLGPDEAAYLFPSSGDAVAHPKNIPGYPTGYDGLSVWRVEHGRPDMPARFAVSKWLHHVYEIVPVPHLSTEPNRVREWLMQEYLPDNNVYPLFQLEDGIFVKFGAHAKDPRQVDFDLPLLAYYRVVAVEWRGRKLVLDPLPAPDFKYDCSPPATLVKRLFKNRAQVEGLPPMSKAQLQQLADLFADDSGIDINATRRDDLSNLGSLLASKGAFEEAVTGLLQLPAIQQAIADEKARAVDASKKELHAERIALDAARAARQAIEDEIKRAQEKQRNLAAGLASEVKKAFERASADASKTLGDVALFKAFLGRDGSAKDLGDDARPDRAKKATQQAEPVTPSGKLVANVKDLNLAITRHCIASGVGEGFLRALIAAAASQSVIAITGSRQRTLGTMLSSIIAGGITCRVAVTADMFGVHDLMNAPAVVSGGIAHGMRLGDFISAQQAAGNPTVVQLNGANRAPIESYVPELLSASVPHDGDRALAWATHDGELRLARISAPLVFVMDFATGKSTYPVAVPLAWEVPVFDTDHAWFDSDLPDPDQIPKHTYVAPEFWGSLCGKGLALPAGMEPALGPGAADGASRMAHACTTLDMGAGDAALLGFAAYGIGRVGSGAALQALATQQGPLVADLQRYLDRGRNAMLQRIFELDEEAGQ